MVDEKIATTWVGLHWGILHYRRLTILQTITELSHQVRKDRETCGSCGERETDRTISSMLLPCCTPFDLARLGTSVSDRIAIQNSGSLAKNREYHSQGRSPNTSLDPC